MEFISLIIGTLGIIFTLIPIWGKNMLTKNDAYALAVDFRKQWDLARPRTIGISNEELMQRGLQAIENYERKLRRAKVLFNKQKTRELNNLGQTCEQVRNLILRNQLKAADWPLATDKIGRQLQVTMSVLK